MLPDRFWNSPTSSSQTATHSLSTSISPARGDSEVTSDTRVPSESALLQASVDLIGEAISYASDPEVLRELAAASDTFLPPPGTNYCKNELVTLSSGSVLRWILDIYIYVANVDPSDPNWEAKGGQVFTLVRHSGYLETSGLLPVEFNMTGAFADVKVNDHRPMKYDQKEGDDYICTCLLLLSTQCYLHGRLAYHRSRAAS
ncbi:hypothetical protein BS47DRAFT_1352045 [Hydnum rufescens UP504]|uniref:Uncharacterized protein n=1 Tax=Hydnum rufescens UP504 TaxID=1448309 RepID=A0A9P6AKN1_9AGAM|nr:hypothetical protein BS47DRAFT_1352045 [Hydnum rufescens UP504]